MNNNLKDDDVLEIDLREIFYEIKHWFWVIAIVCILGGGAAFFATKFLMTPIYTAENSMLVLTKETTLSSLADLQMGSQLTKDYTVLTTSRPVLETVISNLDLDMNYQGLKNRISIENPSQTRILVISVEHEDPQKALEIVREVTIEASDYIGKTMEVVPPKIIDEGVVPNRQTSPSLTKNLLIGILLGGMLSGGIVVLRVILDDTIKSEEDVERYLGLSTLSTVPDRKDYIDNGKKKKDLKSRIKRFIKKTNKSKKG